MYLQGLCLFTQSAFNVVNPTREQTRAKPSANKIAFEDDAKSPQLKDDLEENPFGQISGLHTENF